MSSPVPPKPLSPVVRFLVLAVAAIGFLFDTYELLMLPLIGGPALSELLGVPPNNPLVREWLGYILWAAAALALFGVGSGPIRGFAVTLFVGIITTMFTAFTLTPKIASTASLIIGLVLSIATWNTTAPASEAMVAFSVMTGLRITS